KANDHAHAVLPAKPSTMVANYLDGKPRPSNADVIAKRHSKESKPAIPVDGVCCSCTEKCATKRCVCKESGNLCSCNCSCNENKCLYN
ncbi:Hypothetical predicted protein, partial [Paramuricea clavata]